MSKSYRFRKYTGDRSFLNRFASEEEIKAIEDAAKAEVEAALKFAEDSDWPDPSEATTEMYSSDNERSVAR